MFDFLLAGTVTFPMNYILPLIVIFTVVMAVREAVRRSPDFWLYAFSALIFLAFGWPPQFMQGSQSTPGQTAPTATTVASSR